MRCCTLVVGAVAAALLAAVAPLAVRYAGLGDGQRFAVMTAHAAIDRPALVHSRLRSSEVRRSAEQEYFQWWNFVVFDADTRHSYSIYYGVHLPAREGNGSRYEAYGKVGVAHMGGSPARVLNGGKDIVPLSRVRTSGHMDFEVLGEDGAVVHSMRAVDDDTYRLVGRLEDPPLRWDLTVRRVNGYFGASDQEDPNQCLLTSTLFGYHSTAEGTVESLGDALAVEAASPRFRAYAAGSWGCALPTGDPPIEHPWTWFWLVVPGETPAADVGICAGTGRFASPVGPFEGGYAIAGGVPGEGAYSTRYISLFDRTPAQFLLQASSSDGHFRSYSVEQHDWANFTDEVGTDPVPLRQHFRWSSERHDFSVDFRATLDQYFRAPVVINGMLFSDFRAVGVRAHVEIRARPGGRVLMDRWVDTMNAVEYAYVTPSTPEMREQHR